MGVTVDNLLRVLSSGGVIPAAELRTRLGVSPATLSMLIRQAGSRVCRMGRARATRYAGKRTIPGLGGEMSMFRVDESGRALQAGSLHLLCEGLHWWETAAGGQLFTGLPPVLADMAPQGYLGQGFPTRFPELQLPPRITDWSDDHRLMALARRGEDCVSDTIVG